MSQPWLKPTRKVHKWLGYLLAIQIFAWLLGGLVMSAIPLDMVHGKQLAQRILKNPFQRTDYKADLNLLTETSKHIETIRFTHHLSQPVIEIKAQSTQWFHGVTGLSMPIPDEQTIKTLADHHYLGEGAIHTIDLLSEGPREVGYKEDVWQVVYDDWVSTTLYIDGKSGQFITVRSTLWRIFDFFWMLHIMDYDEREDFNNPLLISFAATSVFFCLSGILLLFQAPPWRRKRVIPIKLNK
jgi:uncharacterized iron-regulated membrane protein